MALKGVRMENTGQINIYLLYFSYILYLYSLSLTRVETPGGWMELALDVMLPGNAALYSSGISLSLCISLF